jgi:outer membrane receptor protein involved in Fe transport
MKIINSKTIQKTTLAFAVSLATGVSAYADTGFVLEEVIVTAQKREQSLQEVPVSVSAVSGDNIANSGIENLENMSAYVPNLKIHEGPTEHGIYIRGLGSGENVGFEQSVGMFIDGVYAGKARQFQAPFLDVGSVEVLRGPQGTLYGKNTIAGSITITSARPTEDLEASLKHDYEFNYGGRSTEAVISGPLAEELSGRIALRYNETDGFMDNTFQDTDEMGTDALAGRASLLWMPTADLDVYFKYESASTETSGRSNRLIDAGPFMPLYQLVDPDFALHEYQRSTSDAETMEVDSESYTLNVNYQWGSHQLTSISAYSTYSADDVFDADFSPATVVSVTLNQEFEQTSQEFRLTSVVGGKFDYIVGLYYQNSEFETDRVFGLAPVNGGFNSHFLQDSTTYAAFGSLSWHPADDMHWTLGVRYTKEEKDGERSLVLTEYMTKTPTANPAIIFPLNFAGAYSHEINGDRSSENVSPSLKFQYDLNSDVMLYASLSKAFKSGGFSENGTTGDDVGEHGGIPTTFDFDEEEALALEVGGKTTLLNGRATLNFALFRTEYDDLQVSSYDGVSFVVGNAAKAISQGLEVDGVVRLTESLTVSGSLAYLDATYDEFDNATCTAAQSGGNPLCTQDLGGETLSQAPEWSANLAFDHLWSLSDELNLHSHIDFSYSDEHYLAADRDERSLQDAYTLVNARLALSAANAGWEVALLGKNLTDEEYFTFASDAGFQNGAFFAFTGAPRTLAIQVKFAM